MYSPDGSTSDSNAFTLAAELMNLDERLLCFAHSLATSLESLFVAWINAFIGVCHEKRPPTKLRIAGDLFSSNFNIL
jgi:hypothetical protein